MNANATFHVFRSGIVWYYYCFTSFKSLAIQQICFTFLLWKVFFSIHFYQRINCVCFYCYYYIYVTIIINLFCLESGWTVLANCQPEPTQVFVHVLNFAYFLFVFLSSWHF